MDVLATLERVGISGRVSGNEMIASCPAHLERTGKEDAHPSFSINLQTGLFICFSCGYRGSLFRLITDLGHAATAEEAESFVVRGSLANAISRIPGPNPSTGRSGPSIEESELAAFSPPPRWALKSRQLSDEAAYHYGVLWDPFSEAWILPIRDPQGTLLGWQSKGLARQFRNHPAGVKKSTTLFGYHAFSGGTMIVVESPLDAVRLRSAGFPGAVAAYGAVVSQKQLRLMTAADDLVIALDNDEAGRKACREILRYSRGVLRSVRFFSYPEGSGKDPGEMTQDQIAEGMRLARSRVLGQAAI